MSVTRAKRITSNAVNTLRRDEILRDIELRGFGVRRREGAPSYFLQTRIKGRLKWITIGKHGQPWTPASARKEALRLLQDISDGRDPVDKRKRQRTLPTLAEIAEDFMEDHGAKLKDSTRGEYARLLRNAILPAFGNRTLNDITRADVTRFHSGMKINASESKLCTCRSLEDHELVRDRGTQGTQFQPLPIDQKVSREVTPTVSLQ